MGTARKTHVPASTPADDRAELITPPRATVRIEQLNRPWPCSACGGQIPRGTTVRIIITAGALTNRVEHDPNCHGAETISERTGPKR